MPRSSTPTQKSSTAESIAKAADREKKDATPAAAPAPKAEDKPKPTPRPKTTDSKWAGRGKNRGGMKRAAAGHYITYEPTPLFHVVSGVRASGPRGGGADVWIVVPAKSYDAGEKDGKFADEVVCDHLAEAVDKVKSLGGLVDEPKAAKEDKKSEAAA